MAKTVIRGYRDTVVTVDASNSTWTVARGALLKVNSDAIYDGNGQYGGNTFRIDGTVVSSPGFSTLELRGANDTVLVGASGILGGDIQIYGGSGTIINRGSILSFPNYSAISAYGAGNVFENFGEVSGRIFVRGEIVNHKGATIQAPGGAVANLSSQAGEDAKLVNDGAILCTNGGTPSVGGGAGNDRVINNGRLEGRVDLGEGNDHFGGVGGVLKGMITGGIGNDTFVLNNAHILREGNYVSDVAGDAGNDTFRLTDAKLAEGLSLRGGADHDTYVIDSAKYLIIEYLNEGFDKVKSSVTYELPDNVEELILTGKKNVTALGNDGANNLFGNSGNNTLRGRLSFDELDGKGGNDTLYGGDGADVFVFRTGSDKDSIEDFNRAEGDVINIADWKAIASFSDLVNNHASDHGADVWLVAGNDRLIIRDIHKNELVGGDFSI